LNVREAADSRARSAVGCNPLLGGFSEQGLTGCKMNTRKLACLVNLN